MWFKITPNYEYFLNAKKEWDTLNVYHETVFLSNNITISKLTTANVIYT